MTIGSVEENPDHGKAIKNIKENTKGKVTIANKASKGATTTLKSDKNKKYLVKATGGSAIKNAS